MIKVKRDCENKVSSQKLAFLKQHLLEKQLLQKRITTFKKVEKIRDSENVAHSKISFIKK